MLLAHPAVVTAQVVTAQIVTAQVVGVPDARLGEVGAAFVTLKGRASEAELIEFAPLRQFPRAALFGRSRELRCDRQRQ